MPYPSGRTTEPFIRRCVIEGHTLYVAPDQFAAMQRYIAEAMDCDAGTYRALHYACGLSDTEISRMKWHTTNVIVDYDLPC